MPSLPVTLPPIGIYAANSSGISLQNNVFGQIGENASSTGIGVYGATNCKNTSITHCQFLNSNGSNASGIIISGTTGLANQATSQATLISDCSFYGCFEDMTFIQEDGLPVDATIRNCTSGNGTGFLQFSGQGLYVENYQATSVEIVSNALVLLQGASDLIFKGCTFSVQDLTSFEPLFNAASVTDLLIDTCIFDANGADSGAVIAIGGIGESSQDVRINNCVIRGNALYGIHSTTTSVTPNSNIVIEDCLINGQTEAGIFLEHTLSSVVDNCSIKNITGNGLLFGEGINIAGTSNSITIKNCTISINFGEGILVGIGSIDNFVTDNKVFNNGLGILGAPGNQFYRNEACNNDIIDCAGIPLGLVSMPGSLTFELGQNICCSSVP